MYPITLRMNDKKVAVVGGGKVAFFKIGPLLEEGAVITVISPEIDKGIAALVEKNEVQWLVKKYERQDVEHAFLIIAATNDRMLNEKIEEEAGENQLVNVITNPEQGNCHFPAALKRGKLILTVSTSGASPKLAKQIRNGWKTTYDESYVSYVDFLYDCRMKIKQYDDKRLQQQLLEEILQEEYRVSDEKRREFMNKLELR